MRVTRSVPVGSQAHHHPHPLATMTASDIKKRNKMLFHCHPSRDIGRFVSPIILMNMSHMAVDAAWSPHSLVCARTSFSASWPPCPPVSSISNMFPPSSFPLPLHPDIIPARLASCRSHYTSPTSSHDVRHRLERLVASHMVYESGASLHGRSIHDVTILHTAAGKSCPQLPAGTRQGLLPLSMTMYKCTTTMS